MIAPALGVPRRYYYSFAAYLAHRGYSSLVFDYRGIGDSVLEPRPDSGTRFLYWGTQDLEAALEEGRRLFSPRALFMVGHSCGGQLLGLAPSSQHLDAAVFVGSSLARLSLYPLLSRPGLYAFWYVALPLLCRGDGPLRLRGISSVDVPRGVAREWALWARQTDYLFTPSLGLDTRHYPAFRSPLLALSFSDDHYAPQAPVDALAGHYPNARLERRHYDTPGLRCGPVGHFGFFKPRALDALWGPTVDWMDLHGSRPPPTSVMP